MNCYCEAEGALSLGMAAVLRSVQERLHSEGHDGAGSGGSLDTSRPARDRRGVVAVARQVGCHSVSTAHQEWRPLSVSTVAATPAPHTVRTRGEHRHRLGQRLQSKVTFILTLFTFILYSLYSQSTFILWLVVDIYPPN